MLILDPIVFHSGSKFFHLGSASNNLSILTQTLVSKLSEIWSRLIIPDSDPGSGSCFFTHPGSRTQWSKRHRIPDPDPQHCIFYGVRRTLAGSTEPPPQPRQIIRVKSWRRMKRQRPPARRSRRGKRRCRRPSWKRSTWNGNSSAKTSPPGASTFCTTSWQIE